MDVDIVFWYCKSIDVWVVDWKEKEIYFWVGVD